MPRRGKQSKANKVNGEKGNLVRAARSRNKLSDSTAEPGGDVPGSRFAGDFGRMTVRARFQDPHHNHPPCTSPLDHCHSLLLSITVALWTGSRHLLSIPS